jgi:hypothetical protein
MAKQNNRKKQGKRNIVATSDDFYAEGQKSKSSSKGRSAKTSSKGSRVRGGSNAPSGGNGSLPFKSLPVKEHEMLGPLIAASDSDDHLNVLLRTFKPHSSSGVATIRSDILEGMLAGVRTTDLKDITTAEKTAASEYVVEYAEVQQEWISQRNLRAMVPAYAGALAADVIGCWTQDNWKTQYGLWAGDVLVGLPGIDKLIAALNPVIQLEAPNPARNFYGAHLLMFVPSYATTDMKTARDSLRSNSQDAISFFRKAGIEMTRVGALPPVPVIKAQDLNRTAYGLALNERTILMRRNAGNSAVIEYSAHPRTNIGSSATWFTTSNYSYPEGESPHPLQYLVRYLDKYVATYNVVGSVENAVDTTLGISNAANYFRMARVSRTGTTFAHVSEIYPKVFNIFAAPHTNETTYTSLKTYESSHAKDNYPSMIFNNRVQSYSTSIMPEGEKDFWSSVLVSKSRVGGNGSNKGSRSGGR